MRLRFGLILLLLLALGLLSKASDSGQESCAARMRKTAESLHNSWGSNRGIYPDNLEWIEPELRRCPETESDYQYVVSLNYSAYGLICPGHGDYFPAASSSAGVKLRSSGTTFRECNQNLESLSTLCEAYRKEKGHFPISLTYLAYRRGIRLPSCGWEDKEREPHRTDYQIIRRGTGDYHLLCTSLNHVSEGYRPLQPSLINGMPAKALFLLKRPQTSR